MTNSDAHLLTLVNLLEGSLSAAEGASVRERLASDAMLLEHWKFLSGAIADVTPLHDGDELADVDFETVAAFVDGRLAPADAFEFEQHCWSNSAALREVVSAVRFGQLPAHQNGIPAGFGSRLSQIVAGEFSQHAASLSQNNVANDSPVSASPATNNGHSVPRNDLTDRKRDIQDATASRRYFRVALAAIAAAAVCLAVGLATYFIVRKPPGDGQAPITADRKSKDRPNLDPVPRNENREALGPVHQPVPKIVKVPKDKPDGSNPVVAPRPKSSAPVVVQRKEEPTPNKVAGEFLQAAWSDISGVVAWRKREVDRWSGIHFSEKAGALTGPMTVRTLPAGWLRANLKDGPEYVLDEGSEARVSARRVGGRAAGQTVVRIVHRRGKIAVSKLRKGDRIRLKVDDQESLMEIDADGTAVGLVRSKQAVMQLLVWSGSVRFGEKSLATDQSIRWSGPRIGPPVKIVDRHRWRRHTGSKSSLRKSTVDRLNRSDDLVAALVEVNRDVPAKDVAQATSLAFALDPVKTVPEATASQSELQRIAAVRWLLAADDQQPETQLVWRRVTRTLGPGAARLSIRRWFHAAKNKTDPNAQLLRSLSAGLEKQQPIFVRQAAIHFFRHFTRLPMKEYKPERPTPAAIDSVRRKARLALGAKRRRTRKKPN